MPEPYSAARSRAACEKLPVNRAFSSKYGIIMLANARAVPLSGEFSPMPRNGRSRAGIFFG